MSKKILILIVGETGSGKTTVCNYLPFHKVCSYSTRPIRIGEVNGRDHIFISDEKMDDIEKNEHIIAWSNNCGYRYCATEEMLKCGVNLYIIDPAGVEWFQKSYSGDELMTITIGLFVDRNIREERCKNRSDFETKFKKRSDDEKEIYGNFRCNGKFDYCIKNKDSLTTACIIENIIKTEVMQERNLCNDGK